MLNARSSLTSAPLVYKSFIKDKAWQLLTMASRAQQHLIILNLIVSPRDTDLCAEIENVDHISFEDIPTTEIPPEKSTVLKVSDIIRFRNYHDWVK